MDDNQSTSSLGKEDSTNSPTGNSSDCDNEDDIPALEADPIVLQMILVKSVNAGNEVSWCLFHQISGIWFISFEFSHSMWISICIVS